MWIRAGGDGLGGGVWGDVDTVGDIEEDIRVVVIFGYTGLEIRG